MNIVNHIIDKDKGEPEFENQDYKPKQETLLRVAIPMKERQQP